MNQIKLYRLIREAYDSLEKKNEYTKETDLRAEIDILRKALEEMED